MFNLEQSIADWRRQMLTGGIKTLVVEELENHLREEFELQILAGLNAQFAFDVAVRQIGKAQLVKIEFRKIESNSMKRLLFILLGIFGVLFGMALVLPAMAWFRDHHAIAAEHVVLFLTGLAIVASGLGSTIYGLKKRNA